MINDYVQGRLYNWKFAAAAEGIDEHFTEQEKALVESLAIFGNPGWFMGGAMEVIIDAALHTILKFDEEDQ